MHYRVFKYSVSANVGDEIQSLAVEQYLPRLDGRSERDGLSSVYGPHKVVVIMNGWFTKFAHNWPPSPNVLPVYFGFHISPHPLIVLLAGAGVNGFLSKNWDHCRL